MQPATLTSAYICHAVCLRHETGKHRSEAAERPHATVDALISIGLTDLLHHDDAPLASRQQLSCLHLLSYPEDIDRRAPRGDLLMLDSDTIMGADSETFHRAAKRH